MKIATGIISLLLGFMVTFQWCAVSGLGAIVEPGSTTGAGGTLAGILLIVGGAFAFGLPKVAMVAYLTAALLAALESPDFPDMKIYAVVCLIIAALQIVASRRRKPRAPAQRATTAPPAP